MAKDSEGDKKETNETGEKDRVEITDRASFERWLETVPDEARRVVGVRVALRTLPVVFSIVAVKTNRIGHLARKRLILQTFRPGFLTAVLVANPDQSDEIGQAAAAAAAAAAVEPDAAAAAFAFSAASATYAAYAAYAAAANDAAAAAAAAAAATDAYVNASASVWRSIEVDAQILETMSVEQLNAQPLWLDFLADEQTIMARPPKWPRSLLDTFAQSTLVTDGPWGLWLDWYRPIFEAKPGGERPTAFGDKIELEIATKPAEWWEEDDPDTVMEKLMAIVNREEGNPATETASAGATAISADTAARKDLLNRRPFADALAGLLQWVHREQKAALAEINKGRTDKDFIKGDGFAAHLHGSWGAGKTSILYMMEDYLTSKRADRWAVVHFNAWRHERRNPPWWPLIEAVYKASCEHIQTDARLGRRQRFWRRDRMQFIWHRANIILGTGTLFKIGVFALVLLTTSLIVFNPDNVVLGFLKSIGAATTALGAFAIIAQQFIFGAKDKAKQHAHWAEDPLGRVVSLFKKIVDHTPAPICIFIDDLDRCSADYVVDLLEGVQSAFRHHDVIYVVAADKNWIRSAFENRYKSFDGHVSRPGQPLGYLFLEKIFQMSVPVPGIDNDMKVDFVNAKAVGENKAALAPAQQANNEGDVSLSEADVLTEIEAKGRSITGDEARNIVKKKPTDDVKAAVAKAYAQSGEARNEQHKLLGKYAHYLPDNPRLMVRMVNTFTMRNIVGFIEEDFTTTDEILARWIVLEQRYPAVADLLTDRPDWTEEIGAETQNEPLKSYAGLTSLRDIIGEGDDALDEKRVSALTRGSRV